MEYVDLHTHSYYSDGILSPQELVKLAAEIKLKAIALTDHDTFNGIGEAVSAGEKYNVEIIRGCELSSSYNNSEIHILGYYFGSPSDSLESFLEERRQIRHTRVNEICRKLRSLGIDIKYEEVVKAPQTDSPTRTNVAEVLLGKGEVSSVSEAFEKYLKKGRPAYAETKRVSPETALGVIKNSGGKAYLAHLNRIKLSGRELFSFLSELKNKGLDGIEGYYSEYSDEQTHKYIAMAKELSLKLSGGSDFHGENKPLIALGSGHGNLKIPYGILENMRG